VFKQINQYNGSYKRITGTYASLLPIPIHSLKYNIACFRTYIVHTHTVYTHIYSDICICVKQRILYPILFFTEILWRNDINLYKQLLRKSHLKGRLRFFSLFLWAFPGTLRFWNAFAVWKRIGDFAHNIINYYYTRVCSILLLK